MKFVSFSPTSKPIEIISHTACTESFLYFMVHQAMVYHLHRNVLNSSTTRFSWASAQGMCLGAPFYALAEALQYASSISGKVYQFDNWSEVLPDLLK